MKLENEQKVEKFLMQRERLYTEEKAQNTETHASFTLLDLNDTPSQSSITINILPLDDDEEEKEISSSEELSFANCKIIHKAARFIYSSEFNDDLNNENINDEVAYVNSEFRNSIVDDRQSMDRELNIVDYYERYSPMTAKALINTLFLSRKDICKQCAKFEDSVVYSDRLIYEKKILTAREMIMIQFENMINFTCLPLTSLQSLQYGDYMPVFNLSKTNASGIFYFSAPLDVFDLKSSLEPDIILENSEFSGIVNTHIYHRRERKFCNRLSKIGNFSMKFNSKDLINWMNLPEVKMRNLKNDHLIEASQLFRESQPNRTSLLLLEPLIFMPNFPSCKRNFSKISISDADSLTLVKIVIFYTLAFFIVTIITFYIVYFT